MKKTLIAAVCMAIVGGGAVRASTRDISYGYRMGAGFPGDVNRTHPASILPALMDTTNPVAAYGFPVLDAATGNTVRGLIAADQAALTHIDGVLVRPYPVQQSTGGMSASIGAAAPAAGINDVLAQGFVMTTCYNFAVNPPVRGGRVYVWCAASTGNHVLGGFEAAATGGSTILVSNAKWSSPPDSAGVAELEVWSGN